MLKLVLNTATTVL